VVDHRDHDRRPGAPSAAGRGDRQGADIEGVEHGRADALIALAAEIVERELGRRDVVF
jgi:hypothetical protein